MGEFGHSGDGLLGRLLRRQADGESACQNQAGKGRPRRGSM
jgi:hypothetical protein